MPILAREGLDAGRLALLARRARRADLALEAAVDEAVAELAPLPWPTGGPIALPAGRFAQMPAEVSLRLLGRAVACAGNEGPVELGMIVALHAGLAAAPDAARFRRTLAGAVVTRSEGRLVIERAPARRTRRASNRP
jgi:tRNA(Ile)-lysidine synthase